MEIDFQPTLRANAGRKSFCNRLLRRPTRREVFVRLRHPETIGAFLLGENAIEKPVAMAFQHLTDPRHLDEIAAEAEQDTSGRELKIHAGWPTEHTEYTEENPKSYSRNASVGALTKKIALRLV